MTACVLTVVRLGADSAAAIRFYVDQVEGVGRPVGQERPEGLWVLMANADQSGADCISGLVKVRFLSQAAEYQGNPVRPTWAFLALSPLPPAQCSFANGS